MMGLVSSLNVFILFWIVSSVSLKFSPSFNLFKEFNCIGFIQNIICSYETGLALNDIGIEVLYAYFVSVRMDEAESSTILCVVAIDFVYHLNTTFRIIKEHRKIASEEIVNIPRKKNIYIEQLEVLTASLEKVIVV